MELNGHCDDALDRTPLRAVVNGLPGSGVWDKGSMPWPLEWMRGTGRVPRGKRSQSRGVPFPSDDRAVPPPVRGVALELPDRAVWGIELPSGGTSFMSTTIGMEKGCLTQSLPDDPA